VVSQSAQHFTKYKQIRADYRRLLVRRVDAVRRTGGANTEAKKVRPGQILNLSIVHLIPGTSYEYRTEPVYRK
jgi:hypothetical protein